MDQEESDSHAKKGEGVIAKPKRGLANRRERVRTENVNAGFDSLRKLIPTDPVDRKLSKIEVLRLATSYINHLDNLTRANSCLEAEISNESISDSSSTSEDEGDEMIESRLRSHCREKSGTRDPVITRDKSGKRSHVCTFCLMMTKTMTKTLASSTKRK